MQNKRERTRRAEDEKPADGNRLLAEHPFGDEQRRDQGGGRDHDIQKGLCRLDFGQRSVAENVVFYILDGGAQTHLRHLQKRRSDKC
jgi:hypothetical protein